MIEVGTKVMVRDPWITEDYMVPQAEVIEVKNFQSGWRDELKGGHKAALLKFDNGKQGWFDFHCLKTE